MKKIPNKLIECFLLIRKGFVQEGIARMNDISGFDNYKAISLAEINYFKHDWQKGLEYTFYFLQYPGTWKFGNVFSEHINLILSATFRGDLWNYSREKLSELIAFSDTIKNSGIKDSYKRNFGRLLDIINDKGATEKLFADAKPVYISNGFTIDDYIIQQKQYRPDLDKHEIERADYLLTFLGQDGNTTEFIELYEKYSSDVMYHRHLLATKIYIAAGDYKKARGAAVLYARTCPMFEPMQVKPAGLLMEKALIELMDKKFCEQILNMETIGGEKIE